MFIDGRGFFERPSIPQDGWMERSVSSVEEGGGGGWWGPGMPPGWFGPWFPEGPEASIVQGIEFLQNSFRVPEQEDQFRYNDQPASADLQFQPVFIGDGWWGGWFPPGWWGPWFPAGAEQFLAPIFDQTRSFRSDKEQRWIHLSGLAVPGFQGPIDLIDPVLFPRLASFRAGEENKEFFQTVFQPAWIIFFDPRYFPQSVSLRAGEEFKQPIQTEFQPAWNVPFDFVLIGGIGQLLNSFRQEDVFRDRTQYDVDWNYQTIRELLPYDPAFWQLLNSFRTEKLDDNSILDQPINVGNWQDVIVFPSDPLIFVAVDSQTKSFRVIDDPTVIQTLFDSGWLYENVPTPFDPKIYPPLNQLLNSFRTEKLDDSLPTEQFHDAALWKVPIDFLEIWYFVSVGSQSQSYRSDDEQIDKEIRTSFDSGWIYHQVPVITWTVDKWPPIFCQTQMPEVREPLGAKDRNDNFSQSWIFAQVPVLGAESQHELYGAVRTATATIDTSQAITIDLTALFGFVTANDRLVCTNLTIEALN